MGPLERFFLLWGISTIDNFNAFIMITVKINVYFKLDLLMVVIVKYNVCLFKGKYNVFLDHTLNFIRVLSNLI